MARVDPPSGFPTTVNIAGIPHEVIYYDNAAEVDYDRRSLLQGQIFHGQATIRLMAADRPPELIFETLLHEVTHGVLEALQLDWGDGENHADYQAFCRCLADTLLRNGWVRLPLTDPLAEGSSGGCG